MAAPILNYTTQVDAGKSVGEIQAYLLRHGARKIMLESEEGEIRGIAFALRVGDGEMGFRLPARIDSCQRSLAKQVNERIIPARFNGREHATRVAWRILKDWVAAQIALIETGMVTTQEVFLPYLIMPEGDTLYEKMESGGFKLLKGGGEGGDC